MSGRLIKVISQPVDPLEDAGRLDFTKSYQLTRLIVGVEDGTFSVAPALQPFVAVASVLLRSPP